MTSFSRELPSEPKKIKVVCVAPAQTVLGGMTSLIEKIRGRLPDDIKFCTIATISRYAGSDHPQRGNKFAQAAVFISAFVRILLVGVFSRGTIFHVHLAMRGSVLRKGLVCVALRILRCRYVVHAHACDESMFHRWVPRLVQRVLLWGIQGADSFIALTRFWGEYYANAMRLPANRLLRLPNPAVIPTFIPDRANREGLNILFLGRIGERKGAFETIRAFAALPDDIRRRARLTLAGDGETAAARDLADHLGCSLQTFIPGWVNRQEADRLLAEADVFLLPSRGEGMSMALLEAMAWGLAIVTTVSGGAVEFLASDLNCILVKPGDLHEVSTALGVLATEPQLRLRLGAEARRTATQFSVDSYMTKLTRLYRELASDSRGSNRTQAAITAE
jgi:glycosyltransferase involved in cell wall biosynthesis